MHKQRDNIDGKRQLTGTNSRRVTAHSIHHVHSSTVACPQVCIRRKEGGWKGVQEVFGQTPPRVFLKRGVQGGWVGGAVGGGPAPQETLSC